MSLVILIDLVVISTLVGVTVSKGLEHALPYFVFFAVLLPQESRIDLSFDLSSTRIALATLMVLFCLSRKRSRLRKAPLRNLIVLHIVWVAVSTALSIVFMTSLKQLLAQVMEYYLLYFLIINIVSNVSTLMRISYAMIMAMTICAVFGLLEIYAHWSVLSIFPAELQLTYGGRSAIYSEMFDRGIRARSTFPHPIHFGGALAMTLPFVFYLSSFRKGWKLFFPGISTILMFWALYKTSSRGPWLATACCLGFLALTAKGQIRKRLVTVGLLACAVVVLRPGIADTLLNIYHATFDANSMMGSSFEYRPVLFRTVTKTLNENPERAVFGFGLGSFREKGLVLEMAGIESRRWYTCDSTWILFAYETGYAGLIILSIILFTPAIIALRSSRMLKRSDRNFSFVAVSSMAAAYIVMISVAVYGWGQNGYMLWTVISMAICYSRLKIRNLRQNHVDIQRAPGTFCGSPKTEEHFSMA